MLLVCPINPVWQLDRGIWWRLLNFCSLLFVLFEYLRFGIRKISLIGCVEVVSFKGPMRLTISSKFAFACLGIINTKILRSQLNL